jgi:hypothetical protein
MVRARFWAAVLIVLLCSANAQKRLNSEKRACCTKKLLLPRVQKEQSVNKKA